MTTGMTYQRSTLASTPAGPRTDPQLPATPATHQNLDRVRAHRTAAHASVQSPDSWPWGSDRPSRNAPANVASERGLVTLQRCGSPCPPDGCDLHRQAWGTHPPVEASAGLVAHTVAAPGEKMDEATRTDMEGRFDHDFSEVRIHRGPEAAASARAVDALAYTSGHHIVFALGHYCPGTAAGRRILAHELSHVIQQRQGPVDGSPVSGGLRMSHPTDRFEQEAESMAERGSATGVSSAPPPVITGALASHAGVPIQWLVPLGPDNESCQETGRQTALPLGGLRQVAKGQNRAPTSALSIQRQKGPVIQRYGHAWSCSDSTHLIPVIWPGHFRAKKATDNAIQLLRQDPIDSRTAGRITHFFGYKSLEKSSLDKIRARFQLLTQALDQQYTYHCVQGGEHPNDNEAFPCKKGFRAHTDESPPRDITLCFDSLEAGDPIRWAAWLIIHENVHRTGLFDNHLWYPKGLVDCLSGAALDTSEFVDNNPDSYACFAVDQSVG